MEKKLASCTELLYTPMEITEAEQLRNRLWDEYRTRRENHVCDRCSHYVRYYVNSERIDKRVPEDPEAPEGTYYIIHYFIDKEDVPGDPVTDDWYNLCNRCMNHIRGKQKYELDTHIKDAKQELEIKQFTENKRRSIQEATIKRIAKKYRNDKEQQIQENKNNRANIRGRVRPYGQTPQINPILRIDLERKPSSYKMTGWRGDLHKAEDNETEPNKPEFKPESEGGTD